MNESSSESLSPRERILVAPRALSYKEGIRATGVAKIIDESSVSKVNAYRPCASEDDLIRAYLDYQHEKWISEFQTSLAHAIGEGLFGAEAFADL